MKAAMREIQVSGIELAQIAQAIDDVVCVLDALGWPLALVVAGNGVVICWSSIAKTLIAMFGSGCTIEYEAMKQSRPQPWDRRCGRAARARRTSPAKKLALEISLRLAFSIASATARSTSSSP